MSPLTLLGTNVPAVIAPERFPAISVVVSSHFGGNWKLTRLKNHFLLFNTTRWHCKVVLHQQCDSATLIKFIFNNNNYNNKMQRVASRSLRRRYVFAPFCLDHVDSSSLFLYHMELLAGHILPYKVVGGNFPLQPFYLLHQHIDNS